MCTIIIILILCILYLLYLINANVNKNNPVIIFLPKDKLASFLKNDVDNYFSTLSLPNLHLRNIIDKKEFLDNMSNYLYNCNQKEKKIIHQSIIKANSLLNKIIYPGFYYHKLHNFPWIIGCSNLEDYEFGYPHTRHNIIILNKTNIYDKDLYKTLIHERVHIYQKLFPSDIDEFLLKYQFKKIRMQNAYDRANPDTDNYIYKKDDVIYECKIESPYLDNFYNFNNNKYKLNYTNGSCKYEHPFELMAYEISELSDRF